MSTFPINGRLCLRCPFLKSLQTMQSCLRTSPIVKPLPPLHDLWTFVSIGLAPSCREFLWNSLISQHPSSSHCPQCNDEECWTETWTEKWFSSLLVPIPLLRPQSQMCRKVKEITSPDLLSEGLGCLCLHWFVNLMHLSIFQPSLFAQYVIFGQEHPSGPFAFLFG